MSGPLGGDSRGQCGEARDGGLAGLADQLHAAVSPAVVATALTTASADDLVALARHLEELGRILDGARVLVAGEVAHRSRPGLGPYRLSAQLGCRTSSELLERVTLVSGRTARSRMRTAKALRPGESLTGEEMPGDFPIVREGLEAGTLSVDAAAAILGALEPARVHGAGAADVWTAQQNLVDNAAVDTALTSVDWNNGEIGDGRAVERATDNAGDVEEAEGPGDVAPSGPFSADDVALMARTWALVLDPDGAAPDESLAARRRGFDLGRERAGVVPLRGELAPEVAAQLRRLIDAYLNPRVDEAGHGVEAPADEAVWDADLRTPTQRRHDAFAGILSVAAGSPDAPLLGGAPPTLVVTISADQIGDPRGVAFVEGGDQDAAPVATAIADQVGCAGSVESLVIDSVGRIVGLGAPQRIFTARQRRAIAVRDGECVIPGCHVPATWCEVHHVTEYQHGGATHTDNGVLLCWHHHRTLETSGWQIRMCDGLPQVRAPGWVDPERPWRPTRGSQHRRWEDLRHQARPARRTRLTRRSDPTRRAVRGDPDPPELPWFP